MPIRILLILASIGVLSCNQPVPPQPTLSATGADILPMLREPGPDTPPAGRSLFDAVAGEQVPYPFSELVARIVERTGAAAERTSAESSPVKVVLVPLGRSLQRASASPHFFDSPRVVLAVDSEPEVARSGVLYLKDRLFLGYQEKAAIIEVISYNEEAGRFEFQLVENYKEDATPTVSYAARVVCTGCHQNHAPIFPRPLWDETNANPHIAALLAMRSASFHGVPVANGVDVPYLLDNATDRANEFSLIQALWTEGVGSKHGDERTIQWRAAVVRAAIQARLAGMQLPRQDSPWYRTAVVDPALASWKAKWPNGLELPSADIANRDPVAAAQPASHLELSALLPTLIQHQKKIDRRFEPAVPRLASERWIPSIDGANRLVSGLAQFFSESGIRGLDAALGARKLPLRSSAERRLEAPCQIETASRREGARIIFQCGVGGGGFNVSGFAYHRSGVVRTGTLEHIALPDAPPIMARIAGGRISNIAGKLSAELRLMAISSPGFARSTEGLALLKLILSFASGSGTAALITRDDSEPLSVAIEASARQAGKDDDNPFVRPFFSGARVVEDLLNRVQTPHAANLR